MDNTRHYTRDGTKNESDPTAYLQAVAELRRVLRPGGECFISVPFGRRAMHGWLQVFDRGMIETLLNTFRPNAYEAVYFRYDNAHGWQRCPGEAAQDAIYLDWQRAVRKPGSPVAAEAVTCLRLQK